jgi:uncharacterized phiE125 gp8 family phage protein
MLTVITPASSFDLATLAAVKAGLGVTDGAEDTTLPPLIKAASAAIATFCNRVLVEEGLQEVFRSNHDDFGILLSRYPVNVTAIVENLTTLTPTVDFEADQASGYVSRLRSGRDCWWGPGTITIDYSAGYTLETMPGDIVHALITLVAHYRSSASRDPLVRSETIDGAGSTEFYFRSAGNLPAEVEGLLDRHRKLNIG